MDASLPLQITALFGFLFCSITAIILKSCEHRSRCIYERGVGNGFVSSRMENTECIKKEDGMRLGAVLPLSPLHCVNTHVRYVNDLHMYAKLSQTICFQWLCCHDSSKKTRAPPFPSTSVLADAEVPCVFVCVRVYACAKVCVYVSVGFWECACVKEKVLGNRA